MGFGLCQSGYLILSERATKVIDEVKISKFGAQAGGDTNHYTSTMSVTLVSPGIRARSTGQRYNVPVSRYRTPFEYADIMPLMNDKCADWTRASP